MHQPQPKDRLARRIVAAAFSCCALAWLGCSDDPADAPQPTASVPANPSVDTVVLVTIDTLRADFLGVYGSELGVTPAFDALAARGAVFERAIAAASSTIPSHATMLTGLPPRRHSAGARNGDTRLQGATTLAQRFQGAGWQTAAFVSNAVLQRRSGLASGFAHYDQELPERENMRLTFERRAPSTVEAALHWLGKHEDAKVFIWVHLQDPHGPYSPPPEWIERVPKSPTIDSEPVLEAKTWDNPEDGIPAYQAIDGLDRPSQYTRRYAAEIAYTDAALATLVAGLESRGDTAILLTSDHGESLGENGRWFQHGHASTIELARVPLILVAPGIPAQRRFELAGHVDVMPTLAELGGLSATDRSDFGLSLTGPLRSRAPLPDRTLFCDSAGEASAYRADAFVRSSNFGNRSAAQTVAAFDAGDPKSLRAYGRSADPNGVWQPRVDRELFGELLDYLRDEVPIVPATPNPETLQRLRALGYLGEESDGGASSEEPAPIQLGR